MRSLQPWKFVRRHWRGEFSLTVSCLGNGILSVLIFYLWAYLIQVALLNNFNSYLNLLGVLADYSSRLAITFWWSVGTWRSAVRHQRAKSSIGPGLAKFLICLAILREVLVLPIYDLPTFTDAISNVEEDPQWGPRGVRTGRTVNELEVYGAITRSVPKALDGMLQSNSKVSTVRLDSKGGRVGAALELRDTIARHGLSTVVSAECSSACAIAFTGGVRRWIEPGARLGFHSSGSGEGTGGAANRLIRQDLENAGITPSFLDKALGTPHASIWYPSCDELKNAGVVTGCLHDAPK